MRPSTALLLLSGLSVSGFFACAKPQPTTTEIKYPKMVLSETALDFGETDIGLTLDRTFQISNEGEMPMGIGTIDMGPGMEGNFTVTYDVERMECPEGSGDTGATADAKDTAPPEDTGNQGGQDSGADPVPTGVLFVLNPGCHIPITTHFTPIDLGDIYGSVVVTAVQAEPTKEQTDKNLLPDYLRDPTHWEQQVYLHGMTQTEQGLIVVRPRAVDFGYVNVSESASSTRQIGIANVGTGSAVITGVELSSTCDPAFDITYAPSPGRTLQGGETTLVEVTFTPLDTDAAYCEVLVYTDDVNNPEIDVSLRGNSGSDPENQPPQVVVRSPDPGYRFNGVGNLRVELNLFDVNQPADTLICKIKSAVLLHVSVATCTPGDASGHVFVDIPGENLEPGVDTLLVTVTDASETTAYASTSVVVASSFPDGDDDGDGFDEASTPPDCDDTDRNTYPEAAEVNDLADNNCNGLIDEDTDGYDDDGDAFTEQEGDCNDFNSQAYPGAPERGDGVDNDCDGLVDEGTSLYDDDGDGYAEVNNDCDDRDPLVSPAAVELCDGIDNDCDGVRDAADGCASTNSPPIVIGKVNPSQNACLSGERLSLGINVVDPDGQPLTYSWSDDAGTGTLNFDNPTAETVNWTCPEVSEDSLGRKYNVYVVAYDPDNNQVWQFTQISVYPADYELYEPYIEVTQATE